MQIGHEADAKAGECVRQARDAQNRPRQLDVMPSV